MKIFKYDKEFKIKHLGEGEWVLEPDGVEFKYKGYHCIVKRIVVQEPYAKDECFFGGHFCAYVRLSKEHLYFGKHHDDININCHGGLTYAEKDEDCWLIGFDCAHSFDCVPSIEKRKKEPGYKPLIYMLEGLKMHPLFLNPTYKNMRFCMKECRKIVNQIIDQTVNIEFL